MSHQIDQLLIALVRLIYSEGYDTLCYLAMKYANNENLDEYYESYKKDILLNLSPNSEVAEESYKQVINLALYIREKVLPEILQGADIETEYFFVKEKIQKCKFNWLSLVESYVRSNNEKKFILKEYTYKKDSRDKKEFIKHHLSEISSWANNRDSLLSEFYYVDDLQRNQISVILQNEPALILLKEAIEGEKKLGLHELLRSYEHKDEPKGGAKVPHLLQEDGIFRLGDINLSGVTKEDSFILTEEEDKFIITFNDNNPSLKMTVPKTASSPELNNNFDYKKDKIVIGHFEMLTITAILQIGREQIVRGNTITFTFRQICSLINAEPSTRTYERLQKAIFYLKLNIYSVKVSDTNERIFNIISAIEKPIFNSDREKEWTVTIDDLLKDQICSSHYFEIYTQQLASFNYELSSILFKILLLDAWRTESDIKEYRLAEISKRAYMSGKPNIRKKKIINSLEEILKLDDSPIESYVAKYDNSVFEVQFRKKQKSLPLVGKPNLSLGEKASS